MRTTVAQVDQALTQAVSPSSGWSDDEDIVEYVDTLLDLRLAAQINEMVWDETS